VGEHLPYKQGAVGSNPSAATGDVMKRFFTALFITVLILTGCVSVTRFDKDTYRYLTFTKADVVKLYEDKGKIDPYEWELKQESILEYMNRMIEYEANKKKNKDTSKQFTALKEIYLAHTQDEEWDDLERELYMDTITLAFDGLIETENSKSRGSIF
jgi:uncharacterized protein YceK